MRDLWEDVNGCRRRLTEVEYARVVQNRAEGVEEAVTDLNLLASRIDNGLREAGYRQRHADGEVAESSAFGSDFTAAKIALAYTEFQ